MAISSIISKNYCGNLLWIRDLNSTNGTFVNQNRIIHAQLLEPEDIISIGHYRFKLKSISVSNYTAASETICSTFSGNFSGLSTLAASLKKLRTIAPNKVVLEINEKAAADTDVFLQVRHLLDQLDMGLAFDDFGVGQTRLVELAKMAPDYLKFDMSLIRKIHLAPKRLRQMVATLIKASHDLGCIALAEGIECFKEADVCEALGFDLGQGYLFGKPAPIDSINNDFESTLIFE